MLCEKCGTEIGDDVQFCPKCGFNIRPVTTVNVNERKRHGFTTFWLILSLISFIISGGSYLFSTETIAQNLNTSNELIMLFGFVSMVGIIGDILLLCWKKIGFWIFIGISVVSLILNMKIGLTIVQSLFGLIGLAIMWGVLHIRKNGKTAWEQLE
jgi:membrane associated rhomboid family serine protease